MSGELPPPPDLRYGAVVLHFESIGPGDPAFGYVPYYHFHIRNTEGEKMGHINFRVGDTPHVRYAAGHIGYAVDEAFRGHGFAFQACRAIERLVFSLRESVILTCNPDNAPSIKTIEKLGALPLGLCDVPESDPMFAKGVRVKLRYRWDKPEEGVPRSP